MVDVNETNQAQSIGGAGLNRKKILIKRKKVANQVAGVFLIVAVA